MKIERMLLICGIFIATLMCILVYDGFVIYNRSQVKLSDAPILAGSSTTSLTNASFTIDGVYRSEDRTQAMVIISGDLSSVSYIADTYKVFLLGPSAAEYSGGLYVFGDLNKLCVYITNTNGFKPEQTQLMLKSTASTGTSTRNKTDDMSFFINLGASGAQTVSFMSNAGLDIERMTNSAFSYNDDADIRSSLATLQSDMVYARSQLSNIRQNIDKAGLQLPTFPEWMTDDVVANRERTNSEYIQTSYVFEGAADFDWENVTRLNNYAEISGVPVELIGHHSGRPDVENDIPTEWYRKDNSMVTEPTKSEQALMSQYETALKKYYSAKVSYQDKVAELITTQDSYLKAMKAYTSNVGGDAITGVTQK
jgi:hypothetical protein